MAPVLDGLPSRKCGSLQKSRERGKPLRPAGSRASSPAPDGGGANPRCRARRTIPAPVGRFVPLTSCVAIENLTGSQTSVRRRGAAPNPRCRARRIIPAPVGRLHFGGSTSSSTAGVLASHRKQAPLTSCDVAENLIGSRIKSATEESKKNSYKHTDEPRTQVLGSSFLFLVTEILFTPKRQRISVAHTPRRRGFYN